MLISFIIPCFNAELFVKRCISSITGFTFSYEIIAVDDGSSDRTFKILQNIASTNHVLKIITKENEGVLAARRDGWRLSSGEYVCFLDADDEIDALAFNEIITKYSGFDMIRCGGWNVSKKEKTEIKGTFSGKILEIEEAVIRMLNGEMLPFMWGVLYKRTLLNENCFCLDKRFKIGEDFLFNFYAMQRANSIYCTNSLFYCYNHNETSVTNSMIWGTAYIRAFNDILASILESISPKLKYYADRHRFADYIDTLFFPEVDFDKNIYKESLNLLLQHPEFIYSLSRHKRLLIKHESLYKVYLLIVKTYKSIKNKKISRIVLQ